MLVLDEPGNHLDVDTVEALAEALLDYKGTVVFTSHDRHFMQRVATCIVEVRDGRVTNYRGDYEAYLYSVNKEIDDGEREQAARAAVPAAKPSSNKPAKAAAAKAAPQSSATCKRKCAPWSATSPRWTSRSAQTNGKLLQSTDPAEALRLHNEVSALAAQLAGLEEEWCRLQAELDESE